MIVFGIKAPFCGINADQELIAGPYKVNDIIRGINFPKIPDEMIHNIIHENWKRFLPEYA